jgi:hypothetical protein
MPSSKNQRVRAGSAAKSYGNKDEPHLIAVKNHYIHRIAATLLAITAFQANAASPAPPKSWTHPEAARLEDPDFAIQGEYRSAEGKPAMGAQVLALGGGRFDCFLLDGGLPGAGWEPGKSRIALKATRKDAAIECRDDSGKTKATIANGSIDLTKSDGTKHQLTRIERKSPTLGATPPKDALVLFDGTSTEHWENGKMEGGHLQANGCTTIRKFGSYKLHLEFRTPYKPEARGQQRGNSGVYHSGRWETQILDSFGLDGKDNECGGIYSISKPQLNMCLPPLAWQTYDVDFIPAKFDESGKRTAWPRITVHLNGVLVHQDLELNKDFTTSAPIHHPLKDTTGPIFLQEHGNPVAFRNIWIVPDPQKADH